jgi:hypothetical protein
MESVTRNDGRLTVRSLTELVRGTNGGAFVTSAGVKGKEKISLDLDDLIGGKITMNRGVRDFPG